MVIAPPVANAGEVLDSTLNEGSLVTDVNAYKGGFHEALKNNGFEVVKVEGDGYSLYQAVAIGLGRNGEGITVLEELLETMGNNRDMV
jgi:hypothetical protein